MDRDSIMFVHPVCDQDVMAGNSIIYSRSLTGCRNKRMLPIPKVIVKTKDLDVSILLL